MVFCRVDWLEEGLLYCRKIKAKVYNIASNYRPITCLPLMWTLFLRVIADQIYGHLDQQKQGAYQQ